MTGSKRVWLQNLLYFENVGKEALKQDHQLKDHDSPIERLGGV